MAPFLLPGAAANDGFEDAHLLLQLSVVFKCMSKQCKGGIDNDAGEHGPMQNGEPREMLLP